MKMKLRIGVSHNKKDIIKQTDSKNNSHLAGHVPFLTK